LYSIFLPFTMATVVHASPLSPMPPSSSVTSSTRKFALAQVHSDVCLVQGKVSSKAYHSHLLTRFFPSPPPLCSFIDMQCAPRSHTRVATQRSARSKRKSMHMNSSPSSGTPTPPSYTRRTSGYSSGSTSRACWTRRTRARSFSLVMSWNASDDSRTGGCLPWGRARPLPLLRAGENGCCD
jgi:hypothetical protein